MSPVILYKDKFGDDISNIYCTENDENYTVEVVLLQCDWM